MIALLNQIPLEVKIKRQLRKIIYGKNLVCPGAVVVMSIRQKIGIAARNAPGHSVCWQELGWKEWN